MRPIVSYLELFTEFLKIGLFMFGGGYGGIALLYKEIVEIKKWISEEEFLYILGIAESTPGPIAINSATWIGYILGKLPGSIIATVGVVLPAYIVTILIVMALRPYMEHWVVKALLQGISAAVVALILYAFVKLAKSIILTQGALPINPVTLVIFVISFALLYFAGQHPIFVIVVSAIMGILFKILSTHVW
ncbi:MAG: chromate transporter [Desulfurococcaceae archaeon]